MDSASTSVGESDTIRRYKVVLLGEGAVGKTSLVLRYVESKFNPQHLQTIQASFMIKKLNVTGVRVELNIWDTAGQEKFHALGPIYYRDSQGALLIYDITDDDSFTKVKNWIKELRRMLGDTVVIMIVGNKIDLDKNRRVDKNVAIEYANSVGAGYRETSAKDNIGIDELFVELTKKMIGRNSSNDGRLMSPSNRNNILIVDDGQRVAAGGRSCC